MLRWRCKISIHAPSRERPPLSTVRGLRPRNFNPRSLTGATRMISVSGRWLLFQSTLPHGSDRRISRPTAKRSAFQSTLPHGSDQQNRCFTHFVLGISIHAPSRERPHFAVDMPNFDAISIHAPSRERPANIFSSLLHAFISIHAPSRERPSPLWPMHRLPFNFNPRSLTGATGLHCLHGYTYRYISIHAPSRERPGWFS